MDLSHVYLVSLTSGLAEEKQSQLTFEFKSFEFQVLSFTFYQFLGCLQLFFAFVYWLASNNGYSEIPAVGMWIYTDLFWPVFGLKRSW